MMCGIDEAGRGPCVGSLVVAGVLCENDEHLIQIGVRDSKKLTPKRREELVKEIKKSVHRYEVISIPASDIDELRKVMTLNDLEVDAFSKIVERLHPDVCYVDAADVNETRFGKDILSKLSFKPTIISKHKADEIYPVVSAASILAKTIRDEQVRKIGLELEKKLDIPLGSGYPSDPITQKFLKKWVETYEELPPHVRVSWQTSRNLMNVQKTKKLDEF